MIEIKINGKNLQTEASVETPLLWVLRDHLKMTGTKYGCGEGLCGACTVLIDGKPVRSCITPVGDVRGKSVTTIEGIPEQHPVKQAWLAQEVSQCGYCQPGQIMSAVALLKTLSKPNDADIDLAMSGNLCRCGTYGRIRTAIHAASGRKKARGGKKS
jgi:isoquinoline 1-oxidoreductase alpha subunit